MALISHFNVLAGLEDSFQERMTHTLITDYNTEENHKGGVNSYSPMCIVLPFGLPPSVLRFLSIFPPESLFQIFYYQAQ